MFSHTHTGVVAPWINIELFVYYIISGQQSTCAVDVWQKSACVTLNIRAILHVLEEKLGVILSREKDTARKICSFFTFIFVDFNHFRLKTILYICPNQKKR